MGMFLRVHLRLSLLGDVAADDGVRCATHDDGGVIIFSQMQVRHCDVWTVEHGLKS